MKSYSVEVLVTSSQRYRIALLAEDGDEAETLALEVDTTDLGHLSEEVDWGELDDSIAGQTMKAIENDILRMIREEQGYGAV